MTGLPQILSFDCYYPGPYDSYPDDTEHSIRAQMNNLSSDRLLEAAIIKSGFKVYHQYSWPDGSLYKWGIPRNGQKLYVAEVKARINEMLLPFGMRVRVTEYDPMHMLPGKERPLYKILEELGERGW
jgi:hypothetical protein